MSIAVLTMSPERARAVATALRARGCDAITVAGGPGAPASLVVDPTTHLSALAVVAPLLAESDALVLLADQAGGEHGEGDRQAAVTGRRPAMPPHGSLADLAPGAGYADWRDEVLSLISEPEATYLGWFGRDGRPLVAVVRGATLSPLPPAGPLAEPPMSWGRSDDGGHALACALVADVLGDVARCPACDRGRGCPECGGTGLRKAAVDLATALAREVVRHLPADRFELPADEIATWLFRQAAISPVVLIGGVAQPGPASGTGVGEVDLRLPMSVVPAATSFRAGSG